MENDKLIQKVLSDVPALPTDILPSIEKRVKTNSRIRKFLTSSSLLLITGFSLLFYSEYSTPKNIPSEVTEELQIMSDYLSGADIQGGDYLYASIE